MSIHYCIQLKKLFQTKRNFAGRKLLILNILHTIRVISQKNAAAVAVKYLKFNAICETIVYLSNKKILLFSLEHIINMHDTRYFVYARV